MLITVAAVAVLVATLWMPVLKVYGTSMEPTLEPDFIVVSVKGNHFETGELVAFYMNNKVLIKRVIGKPGDWIDIDKSGSVYVNDELLDEPYLSNKAKGTCDIPLPYQVPEGRLFVMGDNRNISLDSRASAIGCIADEQIVGKLRVVVWPLNKAGIIK